MKPRTTGGYALPLVLLILVVLAAAITGMVYVITASAKSTASIAAQRTAFYNCDGIARVATRAAQNFFANNANPTAAEIRTNICSQGGGCGGAPLLPSFASGGMEVVEFDVLDAVGEGNGAVPNGPFEGMDAQINGLAMRVVAEKAGSGYRCIIEQELTLGKIALFQFLVFSDLQFTEITPKSATVLAGRTHFNGNFCGGHSASGSLTIGRVTAAGKVKNAISGCGGFSDGGANFFVVDGLTGTPKRVIDGADSGCADCDGSGLDWREYALAEWSGALRDEEHQIPLLRAPVLSAAESQAGRDMTPTKFDNSGGMRALVDPPRGGDSKAVSAQKYACKADLRIVNGVWYVRDAGAADGCGWPGTPIYSDHSGRFKTRNAESLEGTERVGQQTLFAATTGPTRNWSTAGRVPKRYSYYHGTGTTPQLVYNPLVDPNAVVSYGSLERVSGTLWEPGYRAQDAAFCGATATGVASVKAVATCPTRLPTEKLLAGTRSGFHDRQISQTTATPPLQELAEILPMNFDLAAFQAALQDTATDGELGNIFATVLNRPFNGIVYITHTWPDSMAGFPGGFPDPWPEQGQLGSAGQAPINVADEHGNKHFPWFMCDEVTPAKNYTAGVFTTDGCPSASSAHPPINDGWGFPNAVRLINASNVDPAILPSGISIVTNLPMYVLGPVNTSSVVGGTPWTPVMVAADALILQSSAWNDGNAEWEQDKAGNAASRAAATTTYNMQALTGSVMSSFSNGNDGGGVEDTFRLLERWTGQQLRFNGSMVIGHYPVYRRVDHTTSSEVFTAPARSFSFDINLGALSNQPPGTPLFDVSATRSWSRF